MPEREKYERLTEVEDELEREKIDLMLTSAHPCKLWSGLKESTAVFTLISTAVWWSTGATWGYRMSPVYSAT